MSRFVFDQGFFAALSRTPEMVRMVKDMTEKVAAEARANAPVGSGNYAESIETETAVEDGEATGRVLATDMAAGFVEFGTINNPAHAPLRRAAESVVGPVKNQ